MISKDDIEAFVETGPITILDYVFRYEQDAPDGLPDMSFTVRKLDSYPGSLLFTVSDDCVEGDKMGIMLPKCVVKEMIKALEKVL